MKIIMGLLLFLSFGGCSQFLQSTDDKYFEEYANGKNKKVHIIFSHNINGETHPCGCRNFPLGGIPHANGNIQKAKESGKVLYIDSGDTFFPNSIVPKAIHKSSVFTANKIAEALEKMGLKFMTPGDQDFALGEDFLIGLTKKYSFRFLISNASKKLKLKHEKWIHIKAMDTNLFFLGIADPSIFQEKHARYFSDIDSALKKQLLAINQKHKDLPNKKFILISHAGVAKDRLLAEAFPIFNWIIGSHSQSFFRKPETYGKTKVVQILSRNHYLGQIQIGNFKEKSVYSVLENNDKAHMLVKNNSLIPWLENYKVELDKIQLKEQSLSFEKTTDKRVPTNFSCLDCHDKQVEFWQKTSHSSAYATLLSSKSANNPACIACHSLHYQKETGFLTTKQIVLSGKKDFSIDDYWSDFHKTIKLPESIRAAGPSRRLKISKSWQKLNNKYEVEHQFANVQCLHCHQKTSEHPFDNSKAIGKIDYSDKCITCHTRDQSPSWYEKDSKGVATSLNKTYFAKKLMKVSCPKIETE